ncbi:MAG: hypothetical protein WDN27_02110 [Candidatus Saccharibacteria bacterium]
MSYETMVAEQPFVQHEQFDRNKRDYNDLTTLFAEMVDGRMQTPFKFTFDGRELYASDGSPMGPEFAKGLQNAEEVAARNPALRFEVRRCGNDQEEYQDMLAMARGELPNTMAVVCDLPPELEDATEDVGGYNVYRRTAMLRVLAWDGHTMNMYSQSLDGSDREGLEAIFTDMGYEPMPGELQGQRMHKQLDQSEQAFLVNKLTGVYDRTLQARFGGHWSAGRPEAAGINTYDFVRAQHDIIQQAMLDKRLGRLNVYKIAAVLNERYEANSRISPANVVERYATPFHDLNREMLEASFRARGMNKVFSACGMTIESDDEPSLADQLNEAGYDTKAGKPEQTSGTKVLKCVHCPLCNRDGVDATIKYKEDEKTITCSKCKGSKTYKK